MGDITQALRAAQSGLLANQTALNIVSQNVSNVNTEGYSRKIIQQQSVVLAGQGAGVDIAAVTRVLDQGLIKTIRLELAELRGESGQESFYARLQETFGAPGDNSSVSHILQELNDAAELLAVSPDRVLEQSEFIRQAQRVVEKFADMSSTVQDLRLQADSRITEVVAEINRITVNIDQLNDDIIRFGATGNDVTDLQDQRDEQIDRLAELVDIRFFSRNDGDVVVFTSSGQTLVDTIPPVITHTASAAITPTSTVAGGQIDGIFVGDRIPGNDLTDKLRGGELKGLVEMRDTVLPNLQSQLDELAASLRDQMNLVHNRGTPFPGRQEATGSTIFALPGEQSIAFAGGTDTALVLTDGEGNETISVRMSEILTGTAFGQTYGDGTDDTAAITITELAARLEDFFQLNGAASASVQLNDQNQLAILLNTTSLNYALRDETGTTKGSTAGDAQITFNSDGATGTISETVSGFSNFFGLNDLFTDGSVANLKDSNVLNAGFVTTAATLSFRDSLTPASGAPATPQYLGQITVTAGTSLTDLAAQITNDVTNVTASVVPDGSGFRLRIGHDNGSNLVMTQATGNTLLTEMGLKDADIRTAGSLQVRADLVTTPGLISAGQAQFDSTKGIAGEYITRPGDNANAEALAAAMSGTTTFSTAGGLPNLTVSFADYSASIIARNSSQADTNIRIIATQQSLTDSLIFKSDSIRGVNLDEELAQLIVFEQAFSAAARVISVIQEMIDQLERAVA